MFLNFDKEERGSYRLFLTFSSVFTFRHRLKDYSKLSWLTSTLVTTNVKPNRRSITPLFCACHIEPIPKVTSHSWEYDMTNKNGYIYILTPIITQCACWPTKISVDPCLLFSFPQFGCLNLLAESKSCPISYEWLTLRFGVRRPAHLVSRRCMNPSRSTTHRDTAWRLGRICRNGLAASWSCFLPLNLRFVKGRRRTCVGLETCIFCYKSAGLLVILAISGHVPSWAQISPWRSSWSSGLHRLRNVRWLRWRGGMEGGRMMKDGNQRDLRGIQTYPICDVSLLWVSWMNNHYETPRRLHTTPSLRIKASPRPFPQACQVLPHSATLHPCYCPWCQCHPCQRRSQILTSASRSLPRGSERNCSIGLLWEQSPDLTSSMGYMGPKNGRVFRQ